jgi:hypothetical protein
MDLGDGWSHMGQGGRVFKASTPSPLPNPIPEPVRNASKLPTVTTAIKKVKPQQTEPKPSGAPKKVAVKPVKAASSGVKPAVTPKKAANTGAKPDKAPLIVANPPSTSPLEEISDLLDFLSHDECVRLTRRVVASISSLPSGAAR